MLIYVINVLICYLFNGNICLSAAEQPLGRPPAPGCIQILQSTKEVSKMCMITSLLVSIAAGFIVELVCTWIKRKF